MHGSGRGVQIALHVTIDQEHLCLLCYHIWQQPHPHLIHTQSKQAPPNLHGMTYCFPQTSLHVELLQINCTAICLHDLVTVTIMILMMSAATS